MDAGEYTYADEEEEEVSPSMTDQQVTFGDGSNDEFLYTKSETQSLGTTKTMTHSR